MSRADDNLPYPEPAGAPAAFEGARMGMETPDPGNSK
jgi:hypothetical protein